MYFGKLNNDFICNSFLRIILPVSSIPFYFIASHVNCKGNEKLVSTYIIIYKYKNK